MADKLSFKQFTALLFGWNPPGRRAKPRLFALYPARKHVITPTRDYLATATGSITVGAALVISGIAVVTPSIWSVTFGNYYSVQKQAEISEKIFEETQIIAIAEGDTDTENTVFVEAKPELPNINEGVQPGQIFARIYVPKFGEDYERIIAHGIYSNVLRHALGHYDSTELPGTAGNFAIAGHRTTYGAPLLDMDKLEKGDRIIVETADSFYLYEQNNTAIVEPTDVNVLVDEPEYFLGDSKNLNLLTLTSCHPKYSDNQRIVSFAVLMNVFDKNEHTLENVVSSEKTFAPYEFPYKPLPVETQQEEPTELVG